MNKLDTLDKRNSITLKDAFQEFLVSQNAKGIKEKTLRTYRSHYAAAAKHLDMSLSFSQLTKRHLDEMIVSMRASGLAHNSISSYVRVMKTFLSWCGEQNYSTLSLPNFKQVETVKEVYTDEELEKLLKRPAANALFCEYRNWVIINFLLNCGCRASTIRNIQIRDVNLEEHQVLFRHTKNGRLQVLPLCSRMVNILREYIDVRGGANND